MTELDGQERRDAIAEQARARGRVVVADAGLSHEGRDTLTEHGIGVVVA